MLNMCLRIFMRGLTGDLEYTFSFFDWEEVGWAAGCKLCRLSQGGPGCISAITAISTDSDIHCS